MKSPLRIVPLGGLGEIGMNCLALERGDDMVVVDCGVMFPGEDVGIDVIHPDLGYPVQRASKLRGVVLTHGHEDHIGAVPFLLKAIDAPIYGPAYALAMVEERLRQVPDVAKAELRRLSPEAPVSLGAFEVRPIRVTHSIADSLALAFETPEHVIVHSGDFRIDPDPVDGRLMELERLRAFGERGVDLLLCDSTNIESPGRSGSEQSVGRAIEAAARGVEGSVFVALFSSNTARLQTILELADRLGRKVMLAGRSVLTHVRVAAGLGYLHYPPELIVPIESAPAIPRGEALYVMSGTQGEPHSALGRLADGKLRGVTAGPGDLAVISARFIPGNDMEIYHVVSALARRGVRVIHSRSEPGVHASGHAHRDELRQLIELLRPRAFIPVHGTFHHLALHAELARGIGVGQIEIIEDGEPVELGPGGLARVDPVEAGRVHVDGSMGVSELVLRDRRSLRNGVALVALALDLERGVLMTPPRILAHGVGGEQSFPALWARASDAVTEAFELMAPKARHDPTAIRDTAARALRRFLSKTVDLHPISLAVVVELRLEDLPEEERLEAGDRRPEET